MLLILYTYERARTSMYISCILCKSAPYVESSRRNNNNSILRTDELCCFSPYRAKRAVYTPWQFFSAARIASCDRNPAPRIINMTCISPDDHPHRDLRSRHAGLVYSGAVWIRRGGAKKKTVNISSVYMPFGALTMTFRFRFWCAPEFDSSPCVELKKIILRY